MMMIEKLQRAGSIEEEIQIIEQALSLEKTLSQQGRDLARARELHNEKINAILAKASAAVTKIDNTIEEVERVEEESTHFKPAYPEINRKVNLLDQRAKQYTKAIFDDFLNKQAA